MQMSALKFIESCNTRTVKLAGCGLVSACGIGILLLKRKKRRSLAKKAQETKARTTAEIEKLLRELRDEDSEERDRILAMDAENLIAEAQDGELDPVKILQAYLYKACLSTKRLNHLTGLIKTAKQEAQNLNATDARQNMLYGLPVSLKEIIQTKGMDTTIGVSKYIGIPAYEDSVIARVLKHCGAIPFVKTNLPQLMLSFGSSNPIFGETSNPHNVNFTPGGSSSGEGSLIGAGGSLLGFGTDIAGSIRNPSHMCGITGLKPTMGRLSKKGITGVLPGQTLVSAAVGPMARDVDTLILAMRALLCPLMFELDVTVPPLPFNEEIYSAKQRMIIGYYVTDNYNKPVPAIQRAVKIAKDKLEEAGHTLIPFEVPRIEDVMRIITAAIFADGGSEILTKLKGDLVEKRIMADYKKWTCPKLLRWVWTKVTRWSRISQDWELNGGGDCSVARLWKLQAETAKYKKDFFSLWKSEYGLDAIICPPFPVVAGPKGFGQDMTMMMNYTAFYNLVDCPAGVVPVTKVNKQDMEELKNYKGHFGDPWDRNIKEACKDSIDMPVGVQIVALPWQEEICLKVMKEIETLVDYKH